MTVNMHKYRGNSLDLLRFDVVCTSTRSPSFATILLMKTSDAPYPLACRARDASQKQHRIGMQSAATSACQHDMNHIKDFLLQSPTEITTPNADYWSLSPFSSQQYKPLIDL